MTFKPWILVAALGAAIIAPCHAQYGDVDGDGKVTLGDARMVLSYAAGQRYGGVTDMRIRRYGDIAPRLTATTFGDGNVTVDDAARTLRRASGLETDAPEPDFWPANAPPVGGTKTATNTDYFSYLDQFGAYTTASVPQSYVWNGNTVHVYYRSDGTEYDIFKDANNDIWILKCMLPINDQPYAVILDQPIPLLYQKQALSGALTTWTGQTTGTAAPYGNHPVPYTVTVMGRGPLSVPAAGGLPFDGTLEIRVDVALLRTAHSALETQQSWFFWLAPYVGPIQEGRNPIREQAAPDISYKPLLQAQTMTIAGVSFPGH